MIVDRDTTAFLLAIFSLCRWIIVVAAVTPVAIVVDWRFDRYRVRVTLP